MGHSRPAEIARVTCFEHLTLGDLEQMLRKGPGYTELFDSIEFHLDDGVGDPSHVDPGPEAASVAYYFCQDCGEAKQYARLWKQGKDRPIVLQKDIDAYTTRFYRKELEKKRAEIAANFGLRFVFHPFAWHFYRTPIEHIDTFRGVRSFAQIADVITTEIPEVRTHRTLKVLYPGAGKHIAPLLTALLLIVRGVIDSAEFTYTEIKDEAQTIASLLATPLFDSVRLQPAKRFPGGGTEQFIDVVYHGHPIRIRFALKRSGTAYYRPEYLKTADLVIIHDPGTNSYRLLAETLLHKAKLVPDKRQLLVMEGKHSMNGPNYDPRVKLPITPREVLGPYGHCKGGSLFTESGLCRYDTAYIIPLHDPRLLTLGRSARSTREILSTIIFEKLPIKK